jgi:hypothetical protein
MARAVGISKTTVQRIWKLHRIRPVSAPEPESARPRAAFAQQVTDFVGLCLDPPGRAMAFSVDRSKTSAPGGGPATSAAPARPEDAARVFRTFLQTMDREVPRELDVHLVVDTREPASAPEVRRWLVRHPRFIVHLLPPTGGAPNLIDRVLRELAQRKVRSGTPESAVRLHRAVRRYFSSAGNTARPFLWIASAEEIRSRPAAGANTAGYYWTDS